jgi:geranylgeranyl diphosphate synthase, type I
MNLKDYQQARLPVIENRLQADLSALIPAGDQEMHLMLAYHMGWVGVTGAPKASGKRLRPLLVLMANEACGGDWQSALPAASAVSLLHNFSLIHDDIEDNSDLRRGRPTVWRIWGMPLALNAGDLMFSFPYACLLSLPQSGHTIETVLAALAVLQNTIQQLVHGQHLDMRFETRADVALDDYWQMIAGKTAALIACCCQLGALLAGEDAARQAQWAQFGRSLGLAFQVVDDWLGIWGDPAVTGKDTYSDLLSHKKTIPILYGIAQNQQFAQHWRQGFTQDDLPALAQLLEQEGAQDYTLAQADDLTKQALAMLDDLVPSDNPMRALLTELATTLTRRSA